MKRLLVWLIVAVAVLIAGGLGWLLLRPPDPVVVNVSNESHQPIAKVLLFHEKGSEVAEDIPVGEQRTLKFYPRGETSYTLEVRFADGTCLEGRGSYAEPGYTFTEAVTDFGVTNELDGMRY